MPNPLRLRLWTRLSVPLLAVAVSLLTVQSCQRGGETQPIAIQSAAAAPAPPEDADPFLRARHLHLQGVAGNVESHKRAYTMLKQLHAERPDDAMVTAYLGSNRLIAARDHWWPPTKGELATEGTLLLDAALEAEPDNLEIRFLRGTSTINLPKKGGRYDIAADDLKRVAEASKQAVADGELEARFAAAACVQHARVLTEAGDATTADTYRQLAQQLTQ